MLEIFRNMVSNRCIFQMLGPSTPTRVNKFFQQRGNLSTLSNENKQSNRVTSIKKNITFRYIDYVKNYEKIMQKNFPRTMHVYQVFSTGTKEFYNDLKRYVKIRKKQTLHGPDILTHEELQIAFTMPKDLLKITPILLVSAIPFTNYVIFPLAFYFPHLLLTSHYWSIQDKANFLMRELRKRLKHSKPLLRCMQAQLKAGIPENEYKQNFKKVVANLGSGTHPTSESILSCIKIFSGPPFGLNYLKRKHKKELLSIHGISTFRLFSKRKLIERGQWIKRMDNAILREGGPSKLNYETIRWALAFRGLNPVNMSDVSMHQWLEQWLEISTTVNEDSISLILHCPILLGYNHQSNWVLLHHDKYKKI